jgi:superfamily I DNA/RNA helicase
VRVATMHRVKGLEFPCMLLASVQAGEMARVDNKNFADAAAKEAYIEQERRLLYVAATRARDELSVTGYGQAGDLLANARAISRTAMLVDIPM